MTSHLQRFQNNIQTLLPEHICIYILQFFNPLEYKDIFRYAQKYFYNDYQVNHTKMNEWYVHSRIRVPVYALWRLVSKYYYYIDSNSKCTFCTGRYKYFSKNLKCEQCGYVNNHRYCNNNWNIACDKRKMFLERIKDNYRITHNLNSSDSIE